MRATALACLLAAVPAAAGSASPAPTEKSARLVETLQCDLTLNVADPDPKGLNVRASPGKPAGRVIARLVPTGEWIEMHVTGNSGDWLRIDHAAAIDDEAVDGMREVFRGQGWVHVSGVGISELSTGEGTVLRAAPDDNAAVVRKVMPDSEPKQTRVLGCHGKWLRVEADGVPAWTRSFCTNERTTCS
jgi:SH3-like domain-containing protein